MAVAFSEVCKVCSDTPDRANLTRALEQLR